MPLLLRENTPTCRSEEDLAGIKEFYREFSLCRGGAVSFLTLMLTRAVKDISFAGIVVAIVGGVLPSCHAAVSRKEIMSYNLDYYTLKQDADVQKAAVEELEEKIKQGKKVKQEASAKANQEKLNKAKGLLQRIMKDFRSEVIVEEKYDDNIYLTHESRVSAFTTTIDTAFTYTPEIVWKQGHTSFSAKISGGPDENVTKRGTFTKARGEVRTSLRHTRGKYSFGANYNLKKDYSTSTELKTGAIEPETLVSFWERSYGATASMDWKYLPTDIEYYNKASLYRKDNRESNLIVQDVMLTNYFDIFPKTRFLYSYEYEVDKYPEREDTGSDSVTNTYWVGVKGRLSSKIDGVAKFGYQSKKMHVGGTISSDTEKIQLDYQMSQRLSHMIQASRNLESTMYVDETYVETNEFKLYSNYLPPFNSRLKFGWHFGFTNYGYSSGRRDDLYEGGLLLSYAMRYNLGVSAEYIYKYNSSSEETATYRDQTVSLKVTRQF